MAKRTEKMSWQAILVVIVVLAMIIGLIGMNIFATTRYAPAAPQQPAPSAQNPITNIQVQTEGSGAVQVTPK